MAKALQDDARPSSSADTHAGQLPRRNQEFNHPFNPTIPNTALGDLLSYLDEGGDQNPDVPPSENPLLTGNNIVSAFIAHTACDYNTALWLAYIFRTYFFIHTIITRDVEDLKWLGHEDNIQSIFEKCDYIIPLVTDQFVKSIASSDDPRNLSDDQLTLSRIKAHMQAQLFNSQGKNYHIRPVCHKVCKQVLVRLRSNLELRWNTQLWKDVPDLAKSLKKTKNDHFNNPVVGFQSVENGIRSNYYLSNNLRSAMPARETFV